MTNEDIQYENPLTHPWERVALKELVLIAHGLTSGAYPSALELLNKLIDLCQYLDGEYGNGDILHTLHPKPPKVALDVVGIHVGAVAIASEDLSKLLGISAQAASTDLMRRGRAFYEACSPDVLEKVLVSLVPNPPDEPQ